MCDSRQPTDGAGSDEAVETFNRLANEGRDEALARGQSVTRLEDSLGRAIAGPARQSPSAQQQLRDREAVTLGGDAATLERAAELLRSPLTPGTSYSAAHDCDRLAAYFRREAKKLRSGG